MRVLLASASPRRKEILSELIPLFEVKSFESDENYIGECPENTVIEIARRKLKAVPLSLNYDLIIACDTLVYLDGKYYGKPQSRKEAELMLAELSGKTHTVVSGIIVATEGQTYEKAVSSAVTFKNINAEDIRHYLDNYVYEDKAGAYAVQDNVLVKEIKGSYYNVVGLPKEELKNILETIYTERKTIETQ